jgi:para-aminobenzoate synthetase component 1
MSVLVQAGPDGPAAFLRPRAVLAAWEPGDVLPLLAKADRARAGGAWVAGYFAYEAGYALEPRLAALLPPDRSGPLVLLGLFDAPAPDHAPDPADDAHLAPSEPVIERAAYDAAIARLLAYVAAGDCYQVNLTFPLRSRLLRGTPQGLWRRLVAHGQAGQGAFVDLGHGPIVVSVSPETFFHVDAAGAITARPMKGTAPRDSDPARDATFARALHASEKARAENLMIVDLLRNDVGRLARLGSVGVPDLYRVETYPTVHQMTSTVTATLAAPPSLATLMPALFPCGSVTGAPKIRAMEIIRELEHHPRGAYCGAVGWMAPDGRAAFNVAIRTLSIEGDDVTLNVGGGVVADSTAAGEWEEALWKARFLRPAL